MKHACCANIFLCIHISLLYATQSIPYTDPCKNITSLSIVVSRCFLIDWLHMLKVNETYRHIHAHIYVSGHTGTLGGLVASLSKVAIYSAYAICCKRLWSMPALIPGLSGIRW